jgi:hypothetical protein
MTRWSYGRTGLRPAAGNAPESDGRRQRTEGRSRVHGNGVVLETRTAADQRAARAVGLPVVIGRFRSPRLTGRATKRARDRVAADRS